MLKRTNLPLIAFFCLLSPAIIAQPISVLGGGQKAQECFMNAEIAAQNLVEIGKDLLESCDYALMYSNLSLKDQAATYANRGIVHAAMNDFDSAMDDYEAAIKMKPLSPEFYVNRGNSYFMTRDYAKALDDYELSIKMGIRQLHFVHYNMGMVFEKLGSEESAESEYQLAMEINPGWDLPETRLVMMKQRMAEKKNGEK